MSSIEHKEPLRFTELVELSTGATSPQRDFRHAAELALMAAGFNRTISHLETDNALHRDRAEIDALTGTGTQRAYQEDFPELVQRAHDREEPLAVIFIDLDNFKSINDRLGHAKGDEVLKRVGQTLSSIIRANDYVWRDGGDEFKLALPNFGSERNYSETELLESMQRVGNKVRKLINEAILSQDLPMELGAGASLGIGLLQPGEDYQAFIDRVESSMTSDKRLRRNGNSFSVSQLAERIRHTGKVI